MQVQKDAPVQLLLGTDTLPQLGFSLLEMDLGEAGINLLQKQTWKMQPRGGESTSIPDDCKLTMHDDEIPMQAELVKVEIAVPDTELSQATAPQKREVRTAVATSACAIRLALCGSISNCKYWSGSGAAWESDLPLEHRASACQACA